MSDARITVKPSVLHIIVFDGLCNFCVDAVTFVVERDPHGRFRFASGQSDAGKKLLQEHDLSFTETDSFVLIEDGQAYEKSTAALRIAGELGGMWPVLGVLKLIPLPIRDALYTLLSRRRYAVFGKRETCIIPTPDIRNRFLA